MKIYKVVLILIIALSVSVSINSLTSTKNKSSSNLKNNKEADKKVSTNTSETSNKNVEAGKTQEKVEANTSTQKSENKSSSTTEKKSSQVIIADVVVSDNKNVRDPSGYTSFDKDVEAEQVASGIATNPVIKAEDIKDNPPKPISPLKVVTPPKEVDLAQVAPTKVSGLDAYGPPPKPKNIELLPVTYVKEISPAGKAALELSDSGDLEYQKLLTAGFETPKTLSSVISESATRVDRAASQDYMWTPTDPRSAKLWQNVEYNKYGNLLLDTHRYYTPAKFEKNQFGNIVVHAPSDSKLSITTPARNILSTQTGFLSVNESEQLVDESDIEAFDNIKEDKPDVI
jgi:hypothetical protein